MVNSARVQGSLSLPQVVELFTKWRKTRPGKGPIPDSLWNAVARLETEHSLTVVARALGLNHSLLKKKIENSTAAKLNCLEDERFREIDSDSQRSVQVTKVIAIEQCFKNESGNIEIVSPGGWVLRSNGSLGEQQIRLFASALLHAGAL